MAVYVSAFSHPMHKDVSSLPTLAPSEFYPCLSCIAFLKRNRAVIDPTNTALFVIWLRFFPQNIRSRKRLNLVHECIILVVDRKEK